MNFLKGLVGKIYGSQDIRSLGKGFLIAEGGALLATATLWYQSGQFDFHTLLILESGAFISTLVNFVRKALDGKVE